MSSGQLVMMRLARASHFWIVDEGLLESFLAVWHYAGVMDSNIQWKVQGPGLRTESREHVRYDHFLPWAVMDCEVITL